VASTQLLLATGRTLEVEGSPKEVAKQLENAARSSAGTLAWFSERSTGQGLGVNPAQVVSIRGAHE
jgi:hypothetical protein